MNKKLLLIALTLAPLAQSNIEERCSAQKESIQNFRKMILNNDNKLAANDCSSDCADCRD
ncbi:hypothetical protein FJ366_01215 [Candidatus Dependentiae bacterium]|nr:hypothetical protein [Candidatus Dependentiae bacterium]